MADAIDELTRQTIDVWLDQLHRTLHDQGETADRLMQTLGIKEGDCITIQFQPQFDEPGWTTNGKLISSSGPFVVLDCEIIIYEDRDGVEVDRGERRHRTLAYNLTLAESVQRSEQMPEENDEA